MNYTEKIANKDEAIRQLITDQVFGCLTRQGLELLVGLNVVEGGFVIFFDINKMHDANTRYGYAEVDRRIRESLKVRGSDFTASRWYSGDEFVIIGSGDCKGLERRIQQSFVDNGLSIMSASVEFERKTITSDILTDNVKILSDNVQDQKKKRDGLL
jgi:GGDEF domain-containing protein